MIKHRLIATLLVNNGVVVQTRKFKRTNMVGNAFTAVDFFNGWTVDEICVLEISNDISHLSGFAETAPTRAEVKSGTDVSVVSERNRTDFIFHDEARRELVVVLSDDA